MATRYFGQRSDQAVARARIAGRLGSASVPRGGGGLPGLERGVPGDGLVGGPLRTPDDYVPRSRIVWSVGRRGSLLGVDQYGNGYRIDRQQSAKRRCGVVLSLFRVSTNMHVSVPARTPSAARRRATRLYGDVLGARHLSPDFGKTGR